MRPSSYIAAFALLCTALAAASSSLAGREADASAHAGVDPRSGGLLMSLGEWAIVPEARAIRPGSVVVVVANRGKVTHGFRIRAEGEGGNGGKGSDRFEARTELLRPGQTARLELNLTAGLYELECYLEGHDVRGMRVLLEVRADAPLVPPAKPAARTISITAFSFKPAMLRVRAGSTVTWRNADPAPHALAALNGSFASRSLSRGGTYRFRFRRAGIYAYLCAIHPQMRGRVVVTR